MRKRRSSAALFQDQRCGALEGEVVMRFYVVGGQQRSVGKKTEEYQRYKKAVVLEIDAATRQAKTVLEHVTPDKYCAHDQDPSILFKSGHVEGDRIYLCTQTEVLICRLPNFAHVGYFTHPWMNDVHHVRPSLSGTLIVTSTGLDCVLELSKQGELLNQWSVLEKDTWTRFSREVDYRKVLTTKPHEAHPNFSFYVDEQLWTTRCDFRDAVCISDLRQRFAIDVEEPHDGLVVDGHAHFTTVDGRILIFDARSRKQIMHRDLNEISNKANALGWCRGLHVLGNGRYVVAFSRLRPTKWEKNVHWAKYKLSLTDIKPEEPTRVVQYNLRTNEIEWEFNLEPFGMNEIFSVFPAPRWMSDPNLVTCGT